MSSAWACAAPGFKVVFFPTIFYSGMFPTEMTTVLFNHEAILLYLVLGNHEKSTGVISICDLRQDLHACNSNKEQPTQNPRRRCVSEVTALQRVHLEF